MTTLSLGFQQFEVEPEMVRLACLPAIPGQKGSDLRLDWVFGTFVEMGTPVFSD